MVINLEILNEEEYDYLVDTTKYHEDALQRKLGWVKEELGMIEDDYYDEETRKRQLGHCEKCLGEIKNCNNLFTKIKTSKKFEIGEDEYTEFLNFMVEQLYHAKNRTEDFSKDEFGWGADNCNTLIKQEQKYIEVLEKVFNMYRGKYTYELVLERIC